MSTKSVYNSVFEAMTVPCEVTLVADNAARIAELIEQNTRRLEQKFNFHKADSWLNKQINQRAGNRIFVDSETAEILQAVRQHSEASQGIFDITVGTVKYLQQQTPELPRETIYQQAQPLMGLDAWQITGNSLELLFADTRIDLGGVIKEVAVDQAIEIAVNHNATGVLINFGGDIRVAGQKADDSDFIIAVANPKDQAQVLFALPLKQQALTTSAHYARRYQFADKNTSHILAAEDTNDKVISVTVVANSALQAGIFSTALTINPFLTLPDNMGYALVDDQLTIHQNTDFLTS